MVMPAVHPVGIDVPIAVLPPPAVRMDEMQGSPATVIGLLLRISQLSFAGISAFLILLTAGGIPSNTTFRWLLGAVTIQSLWSLCLAIADAHWILVKRMFRNIGFITVLVVGDGIISTFTFSAACSSSGITTLMIYDHEKCNTNHCKAITVATALAFLSWLFASPSFFINFWSLASR